MPFQVKSADLALMSESERRRALAALVTAAHQSNGEEQALLKARIQQFELRYEMSSLEMRRDFATGTLRETADIAEWLYLLNLLKDYERH